MRTQLRTAEPLDEVPGADHALVRADRSPDGILDAIADAAGAPGP